MPAAFVSSGPRQKPPGRPAREPARSLAGPAERIPGETTPTFSGRRDVVCRRHPRACLRCATRRAARPGPAGSRVPDLRDGHGIRQPHRRADRCPGRPRVTGQVAARPPPQCAARQGGELVMLRTTKEPGSYRARVAGARRWWLLPAIGAPATGALACWWVGVVRHATLVRISGSTHAAAYALTVGVIGFTVVAGGVLSLAAGELAGRTARRGALARVG